MFNKAYFLGHFICLCIAVAGFVVPSAIAEEQVLSLPQESGSIVSLQPVAKVLIDDNATLDVSEIIRRSEDFTPVATPYVDFGLGRFRVWLNVQVQSEADIAQVWRLDLGRQYIEEIEVYLDRDGQAPERILRHTQNQVYADREVLNRFLVVDFELGPAEKADIYVAYRSTATTFLPFKIGAADAVSMRYERDSIFNAFMTGTLLAMLLIALVMQPVLGWRLSISFALYISAGAAYVAHADGYTFQYLWPNTPQFNDELNLFFMLLMPVFGLEFSRILFALKTHAPGWNRALQSMSGLTAITALLSLLFYDVRWFMVIGYVLVPLAVIVQAVVGGLAFRRHLLGATPFLCGVAMVTISFVYATIAHLIPGHFDLDHTLDVGHFALLVECTAFAFAILLRVNGIRAQRDVAVQSDLAATRQKLRLSEQLQQAQNEYHQVRDLSRKRREHMTAISHDLRQTISSLRRLVAKVEDDKANVASQLVSSLNYLDALIEGDTLGDVEQHGVSSSEGRLEAFPLSVVFDNIGEMFANEAQAQGLQLTVRPSGLDIFADPVALMRVVSNLVSNAINHTATGQVLLAARRRGDRIRIEVWDTGPGLSEDEVSSLWARGQKGSDSSGHGLGLAIVQEISSREDYQIALRSRPGLGSVFMIHVPALIE